MKLLNEIFFYNKCFVSRATFYRLFDSVYDVLSYEFWQVFPKNTYRSLKNDQEFFYDQAISSVGLFIEDMLGNSYILETKYKIIDYKDVKVIELQSGLEMYDVNIIEKEEEKKDE